MAMITTVTLNPTLDRTLSVPSLKLGELNRAHVVREDLGGKGINVSRALRALGIPSRLTGFMGGVTGQAMLGALREASYEVDFVKVEGETRRNITLLNEATGQYTKINEPGPTVSPRHVSALQAQVDEMARPGDLWAFCGSLPPGAPSDLYANLIQRVQARGGRAFLDTSHSAFREGMSSCPFAVKPNSEEAAEFLQLALHSDEDHCAAAQRLHDQGISRVAVTRGARGLVLAMEEQVLLATPPPVTTRSPIGAGDAALAGLLWSVGDGCDAVETARRVVACGTATAMQEGTGVGERTLVERLLSQVHVTQCRMEDNGAGE